VETNNCPRSSLVEKKQPLTAWAPVFSLPRAIVVMGMHRRCNWGERGIRPDYLQPRSLDCHVIPVHASAPQGKVASGSMVVKGRVKQALSTTGWTTIASRFCWTGNQNTQMGASLLRSCWTRSLKCQSNQLTPTAARSSQQYPCGVSRSPL
jgi:hypothetical protein